MGIFNFFKKKNNATNFTTDNGILGPTYLEAVTVNIPNPKKLLPVEWRRQLKTGSGETKFQIRYYGKLHPQYKSLIVATDFSRPLIVAVDISGRQELVLWDGCKYGYDAIFCDEFSQEQINNREANTIYTDKYGKDIFEVIISAYYQCDFDNELTEEIDENGMLEINDARKINAAAAKRNGFDYLGIYITNEDGKMTALVSEELA